MSKTSFEVESKKNDEKQRKKEMKERSKTSFDLRGVDGGV